MRSGVAGGGLVVLGEEEQVELVGQVVAQVHL